MWRSLSRKLKGNTTASTARPRRLLTISLASISAEEPLTNTQTTPQRPRSTPEQLGLQLKEGFQELIQQLHPRGMDQQPPIVQRHQWQPGPLKAVLNPLTHLVPEQ